MKKNGFTLMELMVVVTVVGILAAIAVPQFTNAMARARAAEVPLNLNKIKSAQEAHRAETRLYKNDCSWGVKSDGSLYSPSHQANGKELGVKIDASSYFNYYTDTTNAGFNAGANSIKNIGNAKAGITVVLNQSDSSYVKNSTPESRQAMVLYLRTFITPSN